jgi:PemK-like, MazF-like toxin of type II toxin-antitoxin system
MATGGWRSVLGRLASMALREGARSLQRADPSARRQPRGAAPPSTGRRTPTIRPPRRAARPRDDGADAADGRGDLDYRPRDDGSPDPGEVVWAWVPYEEGDGRGKDRPVLVVGRDGEVLLGLMLSSKDHDLDAADEARHGRHWVDVGTGAWDRQGRPSEVRVDRVLRLDPADVRREGATLARARFDEVVAAVRRAQGG